ncbi:DNA integrity scanning diadenylate cyclase DisA [Aquipuribacter nitratireducens]|uniref:DNA integrity scanning protein DisA n=1 Tax=Aquipuribacter nitratireducens TaxID=650104 RepID=A0ABW0GRF8_9MICO
MDGDDDRLRQVLALVAPGTQLRDGLERILRGRTGALIVLGFDEVVASMCTGGFVLDVDFSATRLRELAKMDGAIVIDTDGRGSGTVVRAGVQLVPDPRIATPESGTRHRTADKASRQCGFPVISVSQSMSLIAVYLDGRRHVLEDSGAILARANQALATLERYASRLDEVTGNLSALEIEDLVTVRDVATVLQRAEMVRRISDEVRGYVVELGTDGRLVELQMDELIAGFETELSSVVHDYVGPDGSSGEAGAALAGLAALDSSELLSLEAVARQVTGGRVEGGLDATVSPRGYRMLRRLPRLPDVVVHRLVDRFGSLQKLLAAGVEDLQQVDGLTLSRARGVREGLSRLAETSILERYV